jgi:hypothetical protein
LLIAAGWFELVKSRARLAAEPGGRRHAVCCITFDMEVWAIIGVLTLSLTLALLCACATLKFVLFLMMRYHAGAHSASRPVALLDAAVRELAA